MDAWEKFAASGKVTDYLSYSKEKTWSKEMSQKEKEEIFVRENQCYRDSHKTGTGSGL